MPCHGTHDSLLGGSRHGSPCSEPPTPHTNFAQPTHNRKQKGCPEITRLEATRQCIAGVCVLAATSRPDLLDAALLRPGRLDRLIYCGFPDASERGHILAALARRLRLDEGVDLGRVGRQCEGYSGADLSALLSEAQLAAVHEKLDSHADIVS